MFDYSKVQDMIDDRNERCAFTHHSKHEHGIAASSSEHHQRVFDKTELELLDKNTTRQKTFSLETYSIVCKKYDLALELRDALELSFNKTDNAGTAYWQLYSKEYDEYLHIRSSLFQQFERFLHGTIRQGQDTNSANILLNNIRKYYNKFQKINDEKSKKSFANKTIRLSEKLIEVCKSYNEFFDKAIKRLKEIQSLLNGETTSSSQPKIKQTKPKANVLEGQIGFLDENGYLTQQENE